MWPPIKATVCGCIGVQFTTNSPSTDHRIVCLGGWQQQTGINLRLLLANLIKEKLKHHDEICKCLKAGAGVFTSVPQFVLYVLAEEGVEKG